MSFAQDSLSAKPIFQTAPALCMVRISSHPSREALSPESLSF